MKPEMKNLLQSGVMNLSQNITANTQKKKGTNVKVNKLLTLRDLFESELKDVYWSERALSKMIRYMIEKAGSEELSEMLICHAAIAQEQVWRLEKIFEVAGIKVEYKKCPIMESIIHESEEIMAKTSESAAIIAVMKKAEHYIITCYGTLYSLAHTLHERETSCLLETVLREQKKTAEILSKLLPS